MKGVRSLSQSPRFIEKDFLLITRRLRDKKTNRSPFDAAKLLCVAHDLAEIDVEHVAAVLDHDVVVVTVTDAQNKRGDAPAGTRVKEVHHSLKDRRQRNTALAMSVCQHQPSLIH